MITHSNKNVGVGNGFLSLTRKKVMEKKIIPGESFITGKRAYVFDGVKIIRMAKDVDGSFCFESSDVFPLSSSVAVSTELMEERHWEKFYPREMSTDSMLGLIYGFGEEVLRWITKMFSLRVRI